MKTVTVRCAEKAGQIPLPAQKLSRPEMKAYVEEKIIESEYALDVVVSVMMLRQDAR